MFKYAIQLILRRKLRTFLTSLGITIAIVLLGFIVFGMQDLQGLFVKEFSTRFKPNQVIISRSSLNFLSNAAQNTTKEKKEKAILNQKVIEDINKREDVEKVSAILMISGMNIKLEGQSRAYEQSFVSGWDTDAKSDPYFVGFTGEYGTPKNGEIFLSTFVTESYGLKPEEVIGKYVYLESSFDSFLSTKSKANINQKFKYKVSGVFDPGQDRNDALLNTNEALVILKKMGGFSSTTEYLDEVGYDQLMIDVKEGKVDSFKQYFEDTYGHKAITSADLLSFLGNITQGLTVALVMFGLVSAVVASIGIINTMIMSIYEQTKEIGVIKAIGASNIQVLVIFLIQSGLIGLIGGVMGLTIVFVGMKLADPFVTAQLQSAGFTLTNFFTFDLNLALIIVVSSIAVGVLAGIYPAIRAAKLDPVKALRYE